MLWNDFDIRVGARGLYGAQLEAGSLAAALFAWNGLKCAAPCNVPRHANSTCISHPIAAVLNWILASDWCNLSLGCRGTFELADSQCAVQNATMPSL
jgi:hypothetical protein